MNTWPIYSTILDVSLSMNQLDVHETPHVLTCLPQLWIHTILDARYLDNLRRFHFFSTVRRTVVFCRGGSAGAFSYMGVVSCCIKSIWTSLSFLMGFHYIDYVGKRWWYNDIWWCWWCDDDGDDDNDDHADDEHYPHEIYSIRPFLLQTDAPCMHDANARRSRHTHTYAHAKCMIMYATLHAHMHNLAKGSI